MELRTAIFLMGFLHISGKNHTFYQLPSKLRHRILLLVKDLSNLGLLSFLNRYPGLILLEFITEILLKVALNTIIPILTLHVTLEKWEKARSMQQNK
jgi:hypothetical protein